MNIWVLQSDDRESYRNFSKIMYQEWSRYIIWSLEDVLSKTEQDRSKILNDDIVFAIHENNIIIWSCKLVLNWWSEFAHLIKLSSLYILEEYRGKSYWEQLMKNVDTRISEQDTYEKMRFFVRNDNKVAISLYEKLWLRLVGVLEKEWKIDWQYFDEAIYEKVYV